MKKNKILINIDNISDIENYKKIGINNFLFAVSYFSIGYNSFNINDLKDLDCNKYILINRILNSSDVEKVVNNDPKTFKPGDTVVHSKFGEGIIVGIDKEIGQIFFASEGRVAKIALSHPSLNKKN